MTSSTITRQRLADFVAVLGGAVPAKPTDDADGELFVGITEISAGAAAAPRQVAAADVPPDGLRLKGGDVALALMSSIGTSLLVTARLEGAVLGRECAVLRPKSPEVMGSWIYVWTQSEDFAQQVERHITGTAMPRLSRRAIADFVFPLPDIATQREIETLLVGFDEALVKTGQVVADLTELRRIELQLLVAELETDR